MINVGSNHSVTCDSFHDATAERYFTPTEMESSMETKIQQPVNAVEARALAEEAYIYGYPMVLLDVTRQVSTNYPRPGEDGAPINQFGNKRSFPDETFTTVVTPNADTLYSFAFLDLSREPMVLSVPEMGSRYYL